MINYYLFLHPIFTKISIIFNYLCINRLNDKTLTELQHLQVEQTMITNAPKNELAKNINNIYTQPCSMN